MGLMTSRRFGRNSILVKHSSVRPYPNTKFGAWLRSWRKLFRRLARYVPIARGSVPAADYTETTHDRVRSFALSTGVSPPTAVQGLLLALRIDDSSIGKDNEHRSNLRPTPSRDFRDPRMHRVARRNLCGRAYSATRRLLAARDWSDILAKVALFSGDRFAIHVHGKWVIVFAWVPGQDAGTSTFNEFSNPPWRLGSTSPPRFPGRSTARRCPGGNGHHTRRPRRSDGRF